MSIKSKKVKLAELKESLEDLKNKGVLEGKDVFINEIKQLEAQMKDDYNHSHYRRNRF